MLLNLNLTVKFMTYHHLIYHNILIYIKSVIQLNILMSVLLIHRAKNIEKKLDWVCVIKSLIYVVQKLVWQKDFFSLIRKYISYTSYDIHRRYLYKLEGT